MEQRQQSMGDSTRSAYGSCSTMMVLLLDPTTLWQLRAPQPNVDGGKAASQRHSHTVHTRLRRNERLAMRRLQQTDVRGCQEPLLQKGSKRTLSVPSTLRMDGTGDESDVGIAASITRICCGTGGNTQSPGPASRRRSITRPGITQARE
jgi:hypothetical protein